VQISGNAYLEQKPRPTHSGITDTSAWKGLAFFPQGARNQIARHKSIHFNRPQKRLPHNASHI
jgi:hypothetical protein